MPLTKIPFKPGIVKESTNYANEGGWFDCDKVRFRAGMPESIGGWKKVTATPFYGTCRSMHDWTGLDKSHFLSLGTHLKFYILWGDTFYDITPLRTPEPGLLLPANPFRTAGGYSLIVTHPDHGATQNDFVTFSGAAAFDVYTAAVLNREYQIVEIINKDEYRIETTVKQDTAGIAGGGAAVRGVYQIPTGLDIAIPGTGYGVSPYGGGPKESEIPPHTGAIGWGMPYTAADANFVPHQQIRLWTQDNYGEDLFFNIYNGPIYYWRRQSGIASRAVELASMNNPATGQPAVQVPKQATVVLMSEGDRHVVALGCNEAVGPNSNTLDPLLVRWSDQENPWNWQPQRDNTAGGYRLSSGSNIVAGLRTRQETLIWTDKNMHSMRFIGLPYVFSFNLIAESVSILSPNAAVNAGGSVWWMDKNTFYTYRGQVQELASTVRDYVFSDFNLNQALKVCAGHNHNFQEVIWFYPSKKSDEVDRYVMFNYLDGVWSIGNLSRTAWIDLGWGSYPVGTGGNYLYYHEFGYDADTEPMGAWVESSDFDLSDGDKFMFIRRVIPDVVFRGTAEHQAVGIMLRMRRAPGAYYAIEAEHQITPITRDCWMRARGRQMAMRIESNSLGTSWRLGAMRFEMQPDGKR